MTIQTQRYLTAFLLCLLAAPVGSWAQPEAGKTIDGIVAVLGDKIILHSEVEFEYQQMRSEYPGKISDTFRCEIINQKMAEKLLATKAEVDSLPMNEERVEAELDQRIDRFSMQFKDGIKGLEDFYGKPIGEIKSNLRDKIRLNLLVGEMQQKVLRDVKVTPTDIKNYFNELSKDSLPYFSAEVEVAQIVIEPKVSRDAREAALQKAQELRARLLRGENFRSLARIYSDDPGSSKEGGDLGFFSRGIMMPEFEAAAFKTPQDSISKIVETKYGFHIIQVIKRRGEEVHARHILIRPEIYSSDIELAGRLADSVYRLIKKDSMSFTDAAKKFSTDKNTAPRGGFITDANMSGNTKIPVDQLPRDVFMATQKMSVGDISEPQMATISVQGEMIRVWRMLYVKSETPPHQLDPKTDYQKLQQLTESSKKNKVLQKWVEKNRKDFYVHIAAEYRTCPQLQNWLKRK